MYQTLGITVPGCHQATAASAWVQQHAVRWRDDCWLNIVVLALTCYMQNKNGFMSVQGTCRETIGHGLTSPSPPPPLTLASVVSFCLPSNRMLLHNVMHFQIPAPQESHGHSKSLWSIIIIDKYYFIGIDVLILKPAE